MFSMHGNDALLANADHPQHISTWFQSSYVRSISEFKNGAKALAQYALLHRAEVGPSPCMHVIPSSRVTVLYMYAAATSRYLVAGQ